MLWPLFLTCVECRDTGTALTGIRPRTRFDARFRATTVNAAGSAEARGLLYMAHPLSERTSMVAPLAAYVVALGTMLFAGLSALTLITVVKHLDLPERTAEPPVRVQEKIAV